MNLGTNSANNRGNSSGLLEAQRLGLIQALSRAGFKDTGLKKLNDSSLIGLGTIVKSSGGIKPTLTLKIFNAVTETSLGRINDLVTTLLGYTGSFTILNTFLLQIGVWDPYLAASRARIEVLPASSQGSHTTRGVSGHILTGVTYCAYDAELAASTVGYSSGKQAIVKILEAFNRDRFEPATLKAGRSKRSLAVGRVIAEIDLARADLAELEAHSEASEVIKSKLIARNLLVYKELREAIERCKGELATLTYGEDPILLATKSLKVASDVGRTFFGWFESHLKENPNAPVGIRIAFTRLSDELIELSQDEERRYIQGLLAYQRLHSFIDKRTALAGLLGDLKEYEALSEEDTLKASCDMGGVKSSLQEVLAGGENEISIQQFGSLCDLTSAVRFRREMNQRVLSLFESELASALKHFEFVSFQNGAWRDDALGDSVPMERLRRHIYGAPIGVKRSTDDNSRKRPLLGQADFKEIMNAQVLFRLICDNERLLTARPISEFREMVYRVVTAYRKAQFMEQQLALYQQRESRSLVDLNREDVGESLARWRPVLPLGKQYRPCELWVDEVNKANPVITDLREISKRVKAVRNEVVTSRGGKTSSLEVAYTGNIDDFQGFARAGLYNPNHAASWRELERLVRGLKTKGDLSETLNQVVRLLINPVAGLLPCDERYPNDSALSEAIKLEIDKPYFTPRSEALFAQFLALEGRVRQLCQPFNEAELAGFQQRINALDLGRAYIYRVKVGAKGSGPTPIRLLADRYIAIVLERVAKEPRALESVLNDIESKTQAIAKLGSDWCQMARRFFSQVGAKDRAKKGVFCSDQESFDTANNLTVNCGARIGQSLVNLIG